VYRRLKTLTALFNATRWRPQLATPMSPD
jgi:hypothetical protein